MLKYLDVLIGLAVVMVVASMSVTVLTQAATNICKTRGKALKQGIIDLLQQIYPAFGPGIANRISEAVLKHPLVRQGENELGTVIHREELTKLLLELATLDGPKVLDEEARLKLREALQSNGIADPEEKIRNIREMALQLEIAHPELANDVRHSIAILHQAKSDFVAKVNGWFDQTIDRVSTRFTVKARYFTLVNACLVACFLQLDTIAVLNRLTVDDALRAATAEQAKQLGTDPARNRDYLNLLNRSGLLALPQSFEEWNQRWNWNHLPGILVSMLLLNLGAPFWFESLNKLLQLRSVIAQKDDAQRNERQTTQAVTLGARPG